MFEDTRSKFKWSWGAAVTTVEVDARDRKSSFFRRQEVDAVLAVLGKVYHPYVCDQTEQGGDAALNQEHPAPTSETAVPIEMVEAEVDYRAGGQYNNFAGLEESKAKLLFLPSVPSADKITQPRVDARHGDTKGDAQCDHLPPGCDKCGAESDNAEAGGDAGEKETRANEA